MKKASILKILENVAIEINNLENQISELKNKEIQYKNEIKRIKPILTTAQKKIKKYEEILHLTPGTNENKLELLEFFTKELVPIIQEKIESKYTSKIKEFLIKIINPENEEGKEKEISTLVLGTDLEFLYPYLKEKLVKINIKALKAFINNYNTLAFKNWYDSVNSVITRTSHLSCPMYTDICCGIHNKKTFDINCLNDLINYYLKKDGNKFFNFINDNLIEILDSTSLKKKLCIPQNIIHINWDEYDEVKRYILIKYLQEIGRI